MSFIDVATVVVQAGNGGNGRMSFRHEKFIDRGGPDGGDGGKGGDVIFAASRNQNALTKFRYQKDLVAKPGGDGGKSRKHGKNGIDLVVDVPVGTVVYAEDNTVLVDLTEDGQRAVIAKGGQGGFGNAHFVSSRRQAPKIAEKGEMVLPQTLRLELKMIADVGLVGLPNAGKSTFLSVVSNAHPEIADYPFTTLSPNLGVATVDEQRSLLIADIPGLIEGAAEGKGLGDEFLRHIERTAVLIHLIDAYQEHVADTYQVIQNELAAYTINLTNRPQVVALNKIDGLDKAIVAAKLDELRAVAGVETPVMAISAQAKQGVRELLFAVADLVTAERTRIAEAADDETAGIPVLSLDAEPLAWHVERTDDTHLRVTGRKIEKFASRTDFASEPGVDRLRDIMKKMGIMHELKRKGAKAGCIVAIGRFGEFEL